jgi:hypothetical protein
VQENPNEISKNDHSMKRGVVYMGGSNDGQPNFVLFKKPNMSIE